MPSSVYYVSTFTALRERGLLGVSELLAGEIRSRMVDLRVLDGLWTAAESASSGQELKLFVSELQVYSALMSCTVLLLQSVSTEELVSLEQLSRAFQPRETLVVPPVGRRNWSVLATGEQQLLAPVLQPKGFALDAARGVGVTVTDFKTRNVKVTRRRRV